MKVSEVFKRQPKPKQERLVREGVMTALCYEGGQIHAKHDFETPLSNYCSRCHLTCSPSGFHQPESGPISPDGSSGKSEDSDGSSSPAATQEPPTSLMPKRAGAPAGPRLKQAELAFTSSPSRNT
jgi:hypothetical protein